VPRLARGNGGLTFGPALGVIAGVLWALASSGIVSDTSCPAVQALEPPPA